MERTTNPVVFAAAMAGCGVGYVVRFLQFLRGGQRREKAGEAFRSVLRHGILAEVKKAGIQLSDEEIKELIDKVVRLLERVLSGDIGVDAIPSARDLLRVSGAVAGFLVPLIRSGEGLSEKKNEILKRILEENIQLRHTKMEVG